MTQDFVKSAKSSTFNLVFVNAAGKEVNIGYEKQAGLFGKLRGLAVDAVANIDVEECIDPATGQPTGRLRAVETTKVTEKLQKVEEIATRDFELQCRKKKAQMQLAALDAIDN